MKICKYCGVENSDETIKCRGCGANEFMNKCSNCGTVHEGSFCPNCGVKAGAKPQVCPTCGNIYYTHVCPRCGYSPASKNTAPTQNVIVTHLYQEEKPKKKVAVWKILLWIFFFPIMIVISIWKCNKLNGTAKVLLTAAIGMILIYYLPHNPLSNIEQSGSLSGSSSVITETTMAPKATSQDRSLKTIKPTTTPTPTIVPKTEKTSAPKQTDPATAIPTSIVPAGVTPEFKTLMDGYEAFFVEYVQLLKSIEDDSFDFLTLAKMAKQSLLYSQYMEEIEALEDKDMSLADAAYYAEVTGRIFSMLFGVLGDKN